MAQPSEKPVNRFSASSLLNLLHIIAITACVLIVTGSATGMNWVYRQYIIENAEEDAVNLSLSIVELEKHLLLPSVNGRSQLVVDSSEFAELDSVLKTILKPYNILKIKLFSSDGVIVYSTDKAVIGQKSTNNYRLLAALAGKNDSKLQTKDEMLDLSNETRFNIDVVETYVPVRNELGEIVGSFEIYQDTTPHNKKVTKAVLISVFILIVILAMVFTLSYAVLKKAVGYIDKAQKELNELATTDGLTGLLNHREIIRLGEKEFLRFQRQSIEDKHSVFSVIMSDIDHFKLINDRYGHLNGDLILQAVAERLNAQMRTYSMVGRYGGEEFLLILPEVGYDTLSVVAERIREAVESVPVQCSTESVHVTLSLGATCVKASDQSLEEVLQRADNALYQAKDLGRNKVVLV